MKKLLLVALIPLGLGGCLSFHENPPPPKNTDRRAAGIDGDLLERSCRGPAELISTHRTAVISMCGRIQTCWGRTVAGTAT